MFDSFLYCYCDLSCIGFDYMAVKQEIFHIVVEILAIIISGYFIYLSKRFKGWKKYSLISISSLVIFIDLYALLSWAKFVDFFPVRLFHMFTESLAIPAGIILIYLSTRKIDDLWGSRALLMMGIANILVDGYLFFTWLKII